MKFIKMSYQRFCEIKSDCNKLCSRFFDALILATVGNGTFIDYEYVVRRMILSHKEINYLFTLLSHLLDMVLAKQARLLNKICILLRQVLFDKTRQGRQEI